MKILFTLILVLTSFLFSAQNNSDYLSHILSDEFQDSSLLSESLVNINSSNDLDNSLPLVIKAVDYNSENKINAIQNRSRNLLLLLSIIFSLAIYALWYYFKKRENQILLKQYELLSEIELLKKKLTSQPVASPMHVQKQISLDKNKLEKAINSKIGESSWMILNLIFSNPSISNKELAKEVSLSLEGVSSSLRRMYQTFDIPTTSNKKITLIMEVTRLSLEK